LGISSEANYEAVKHGRSGLRSICDYAGVPFNFMAALFDESAIEKLKDISSPHSEIFTKQKLTRFETLVLLSVYKAIEGLELDPERTIFVLASTKLNVVRLNGDVTANKDDDVAPATEDGVAANTEDDTIVNPGKCAAKLSRILGLSTAPITVCNACISGVSALIAAQRLVDSGAYDNAVVCGADEQSPFIISGFQSFHSLSESECRPFDMERTGLNLGEAAATIVLGRDADDNVGQWRIIKGAVRNDAYHLSTPHPQGEGAGLALSEVIAGCDELPAMINAHGTATMYNDQMESKAISRSGLTDVPVNAYKGNFGHTMGAAGVLETIITMLALDEHRVLATKNYAELGVSGKIKIADTTLEADRQDFVKMISGFGGCNAAVRVAKTDSCNAGLSSDAGYIATGSAMTECSTCAETNYAVICTVDITPSSVTVNGAKKDYYETGDALITEIYRKEVGDYPKFYKMDPLARLAFVASELLLDATGEERFVECADRAVVLCNSESTLHADLKHAASIADKDNFFPSPSVFLYTLPNVTCGEIALRNKYHGESGFYLLSEENANQEQDIINCTLADKKMRYMIFGWVSYVGGNNYKARLQLICRNHESSEEVTDN